MSARLNIKQKLVLVPLLGAVFMLCIFAQTLITGRRSDRVFREVEQGHLPTLELNRELGDGLVRMQRALQFAVASEDESALAEADRLAAAFRAQVKASLGIPGLDPGRAGGLALQFNGYFPLAREVSLQLIRKTPVGQLTEKLQQMTDSYTFLRQRLEMDVRSDRGEMSEAFEHARRFFLVSTSIQAGLLLAWVIGAGLFALKLARQLSERITRLRDASVLLGAGQLSTVYVDGGEDELGQLAESFNQMARSISAANDAREAFAAHLRTVIDTAQDAIISSDQDFNILEWNAAAERLFGWTRQEALGRRLSELLIPEGRRAAHLAIEEAIRRRELDRVEIAVQRRDGKEVPLEVRLGLAATPGGMLITVFARDLTRDRAMEVELRQAQKLESVGRLAAGIAHEINTPIQFIGDSAQYLGEAFRGMAGLLEGYEKLRDSAARAPGCEQALAAVALAEEEADLEYARVQIPKAIERAVDGVQRVATIVRAMKRFAHPDTEEKRAADLNAALTDTIAVARNELKYVAEVQTELGELPSVRCHLGDLNQVFLNLMVNAAHAIADRNSGRGTITVRSFRDRDQAVIDIVDTGCGIPEAIRERIFDPFFTTKEVGRGTGQGLAIARSIVVDKHGGTLSFQTVLGVGTTFSVRLPIGAAA